ncbi:MAG: ComEA family DNA-binding protein, partial [Solirubrobacterales bacterium]
RGEASPGPGAGVAEAEEASTSAPGGPRVDVNRATFEELRQLGMSVTQATRVIAYRERRDGFESVEDLHSIPGLPKDFLTELKQRLTA